MSIFVSRFFGKPQKLWLLQKMLIISDGMSIFEPGTRKMLIVLAVTNVFNVAPRVLIILGSTSVSDCRSCVFRLKMLIYDFVAAHRHHDAIMAVVERAHHWVGKSIFDAAAGTALPKMLIKRSDEHLR